MNITVSARIGAGFALMLLLLLGLLITGLTAIGNVNDSLNLLAHQTTPRVAFSGQLQSHFQNANILVLRHYQNDTLGELGPLESQLQSELQAIDSVNNKLRGLAVDSGAFQSQLGQLDIAGVASAARATQVAHRQALEQADQVARQVRTFTDMADEVESNLLDLPANAPGKSIGNQLYETIAGTNRLALKALDTDIEAAVKSAARQVDSRLKRADTQWQSLRAGAGNTKLVEAIGDAYQRYKTALVGDKGMLNGYQTQLQLNKGAQSSLTQLLTLTDANAQAVSQLVSISRANAEEHASSAEATVAGSKWLLWVFFLVALMAAGLTSIYIVRSIKHPLNQIVSVIRNLAAGDLRDNLSLTTNDELGELAQHTNTLAEQLRNAIGQISENAESLAKAAQNGSDIADRNNRTAQAQKDQTIQFANAMREMVSTVREVASSASHTLSKVKEAKQRTEGGRRVVDENIQSIEQLAAEIANAAQVIDKLNERSTSISSVLEVIREIANQTNLLALNAAIEAARAGEQGRGFAVVADEVRTLASRTQDSTTEIQAMIEKLQNEARQAVSVMEKSRSQAGEGVEKSSMAGVELGAIDGAMDEINSMSIQIATASEEQSQVSTEMQRNIEEVSSLADSTAAAAQEGLSTSAELNRLASGMRTLVAQFSF